VRFVDFGTLTQAVRATLAAESRYSRWIGLAGYAAAMLAFGGVLFMTSKLVERYVETNVRGGAAAVVVAASPAASGFVETAPAPAPSASPATARAETKPTEVTLTPVRIDAPVPTTAPHGEPVASVAQAAPASERPVSARPPKPKATAAAKVSAIEHAPREAGKPALLLTAALPAPAYADPSGGRVKSRGLEEMVVPLERGADIAQVAPVELVVAPPEPATAAPGAPLRAIAKPEPQFPAAALKEGVRDGRVLAQMTVNSDGTVGRIDIVEAQPRHVFDKEVRRALAGWRYEAPGRPREAAVEFVFRRDE
jgi:protein TonB